MKYVITGGAGFIGSYLVDRLVNEKLGEIVVIDNLFRGKIERLQGHIDSGAIRFVMGDIRDRGLLIGALENTDVVFHLAAQSNVLGAISDLDYSFTTNVVGAYHVLSAAKERHVKRIIFTSSREVYGEPASLPVDEDAPLTAKNAYGASKVAGEAYCRVFGSMGLETVILRLANVYGPRDTDRVIPLFISQIMQGIPLTVYGENKVLDFVWVEDVVDVLLQAGSMAQSIPEPVNIGSGVGTKVVDLANRLVEMIDTEVLVHVVQPRKEEVNGYIARIDKGIEYYGLKPNSIPLENLTEVLNYWTSLEVMTTNLAFD